LAHLQLPPLVVDFSEHALQPQLLSVVLHPLVVSLDQLPPQAQDLVLPLLHHLEVPLLAKSKAL
jgi:hypothetical protein